ncbi:MAG: type II toxin-antitoxin system VapC family toxin [Thermofilaceae archaeon]
MPWWLSTRRRTPERLAVDSSVFVKWFKKGEEYEGEALQLFEDAVSGGLQLVCSEWALLEVARALQKAGFPPDKVEESYLLLKDLVGLGSIELVPVSEVLDLAKTLVVELNLYASDAVHLAAAITRSADLLTEDAHLLRREIIEYAGKRGLRVLQLKSLRES